MLSEQEDYLTEDSSSPSNNDWGGSEIGTLQVNESRDQLMLRVSIVESIVRKIEKERLPMNSSLSEVFQLEREQISLLKQLYLSGSREDRRLVLELSLGFCRRFNLYLGTLKTRFDRLKFKGPSLV